MKILTKFFLFVFLFCSACSLNTPGYFEKDKGFRSANTTQKARIVNAIENSSSSLKTARVRSLLNLQSSVFSASFTFSAVAVIPSQFRIELFTSGFPKLVTLLVVNGSEVFMSDVQQGKIISSNDSSQLVEDALGVPLSASELLFWSVGKVDPSLLREGDFEVLLDPAFEENRHFSIRIHDDSEEKIFFGHLFDCGLGQEKVKIFNTQYAREKKVFFDARYAYASGNCEEIPQSIDFELTKENIRGKFEKIRLQENPDIEKNKELLFKLPG